MKICMIGAGYVGLVSAACFSDFGWNVTCVDNDEDRLAQLERGEIPIYEPGLDDLVARNVAKGRMSFSGSLPEAVSDADVVFLAVGTPVRRGDGYADLTYVFEAVEELAPHARSNVVITTKSTVPVGTGREIERRLRQLRPDADFAVCSNPEFLREGSAIRDFTHPDRVLVAAADGRGREVMARLYEPIALRDAPVMFVSRESAELAKYAANAFLAMKITFINEVADLCEMVGADVSEVANAVAPTGASGTSSCTRGRAMAGRASRRTSVPLCRTRGKPRAPCSLVEQVEKANLERKIAMAARVEAAAGGTVRGKTVAVLGVTFKPNTDDMREAPSLVILPMLQARGAEIRACDPQGRSNAEELLPGVSWFADPLEAARDADVLLVLTEWNEFRALDLKALRATMNGDVLVDLRNVYAPKLAAEAGFVYTGVGRGHVGPEMGKNAHDRGVAETIAT
ncbi:UDP-glucose dehydrogenase family protein [Methyloceanibacter methanicus]|uniref:UDP-glucose dehydrogenase family protein n=1 Tax=Methyloceanibacter methanicus TaxID=1774968 RepID=UPI000B086030|nr:UDP-glucose/GDP-mannose dehydrogenase family protein [Methyloceanibacter methanicus]